MRSTSAAVQPPIAARSSSTGVKLASWPVPSDIEPPRTLCTTYFPTLVRSILTERTVSSLMTRKLPKHLRRIDLVAAVPVFAG
jgi:hypothetical protein